jgi:hypothetical protein
MVHLLVTCVGMRLGVREACLGQLYGRDQVVFYNVKSCNEAADYTLTH